MTLTFQQIQDYITRLPLDRTTYYVFDNLLKQPYDLFRPIMDMLFDETIVVEDLMTPTGSPLESSLNSFSNSSRYPGLTSVDLSPAALTSRIIDLINGIQPGGVVVPTDFSMVTVMPDGTPGPIYIPASSSVIGADATMADPNALQISQAGTVTDAQKAAQLSLAAALNPNIG